jgi:cytochrome c peroxidase
MEPVMTESGWNMHTGSDVCVDDFQADRAPDLKYRTSPLNGLWTHMKGGFYHDGRFATLTDVINHYDSCMSLGLDSSEQTDLVEYLKSLPNPGH